MPSTRTQEAHLPEDGLLVTLSWYFKNLFADSVIVSGVNTHEDRLWDDLSSDVS